jgi:CobW/HypB/UreG, nucleotide-binding domain
MAISPSTYHSPYHASSGSGSAFPATLAFQIRQLEQETLGDNQLKLDAIITVIDAENFFGYEDTSPTARMQASYTDIILIVSNFIILCRWCDDKSSIVIEQMGTRVGASARPCY